MANKRRYDDLGFPVHQKLGQLQAVNYVVTFELGAKKPTHVIIHANPLKFGNDLQGVSFNLAYPQVKITMYPSGRGLLVGARNVMQILYAIKVFMLELKKCGVTNVVAEVMRIRNITATVKMCTGMFDSARFSEDHTKEDTGKVFFDLSFFPGMRVRFKNVPLCCTVFATGTMNLTGSNKTSDIEAAFECFEQIKSQYVVGKDAMEEFEQRMKRIKAEHQEQARKQDRKETKRAFLALAGEDDLEGYSDE